MGIRKLIIIITALSTASAFASPFRVPCGPSGYQSPFQDLIHNVNIVGPTDGRGPITDLVDYMSSSEMADAGRATGRILCPGTKYGNGAEAYGAIVGDDLQIQTDVHVFIDDEGRRREPLSECTFQPKDKSVAPIKLVFQKDSYKFGTLNHIAEPNKDFASVRLSKKVPGAKPYPIDTTGKLLRSVPELIAVSGDMDRMSRIVPHNVPVGQVCRNRKIYRNGVFITDCDMTEGGSGSLLLVRDPDTKRLVALGTVTSTGKSKLDNEPFDIEKGSWTKAFAYEGTFLQNIIALSNGGRIVTAEKDENSELPIVPASYGTDL